MSTFDTVMLYTISMWELLYLVECIHTDESSNTSVAMTRRATDRMGGLRECRISRSYYDICDTFAKPQ